MKRVAPTSPGFLQRLLRNPMLRAISTMVGATGLGQLAIFATLPLITRLYDPAAFGLHALMASFVGIASVGACLCLDLAIVQGQSPEEADELCIAALFSVPVTAAISALVLALFIAIGLFGYGQLPWWSVLVAAAMVCLNGLYVASRYRLLREQRFPALARATLLQSGGRALAPLAWFQILPNWTGLSLGELSGRALGVYGLLGPLLSQLRAHAAWRSTRAWWRVVKREHRYTVLLLAAVLLDSSASMLIPPLLAGAYGAKAAGEYFLIFTILVAPSALIGTATADVIHTRGAMLLLESPEQLLAFLRKMAMLLLLAGCAIYLPIYFLAPYAFPAVFGAKWTLIVPIAQAMTPFMIVAFVASPCSRLLLVVNRTGLKAISDTVRLIGTPAVIVVATAIHLPFTTAIWGLTWFLAVAYGVYFGLTWLAVHYVSRYQREGLI